MNKEKIISRFITKNCARRRLLFLDFAHLIASNATAEMVAFKINEDLEMDGLVDEMDIYYCRRYFIRKKNSPLAKHLQNITGVNPNNPKTPWQNIKW